MNQKKKTNLVPLTNDELSTLSDALIATIENEKRAAALVIDRDTVNRIHQHMKTLAALNFKICSYMIEEQEETK